MIKEIGLEDKYSFLYLGSLIKSDFEKTNDLEKILESTSEKIYGYYQGDLLIGFIYISKSFENVDIIDIVVDGEYRRKGIASAMISFIVDNYKDINSIFLEVNENNIAAIETYRKNNFEVINVRNNYYGSDAAIVMKRDV